MPAFGMRLILFTCIFLFIYFIDGNAQSHRRLVSNTTISLSGGSATYYGDLSPYRNPLRGILKSSSYNFAFSLTREFNERWGQNIDLRFTELKGSDYKYNTNIFPWQIVFSQNLVRNLHFRNHIFQAAYSLKYYIIENTATISRRKVEFLPYIIAGIGISTTNPKAKLPSDNGSGKWTSLRNLHTSGENISYKPYFFYIPIGLGFNKKINHRWDFKAQATFNVPFNDYIDDVSQTLFLNKEEFKNETSFKLHNRVNEKFDALTGKDRTQALFNSDNPLGTIDVSGKLRGTNSTFLTLYDIYVTTEVGIIYWLDWKIR